MPDPLNLLSSAVGQRRPDLVYAEVSVNQQAPQSFDAPLYVTMPQWQPDRFIIINDWVACNGGTLPTGGEACLLAKDDQRNWRCVWWRGSYTDPHTQDAVFQPGDLIASGAASRSGALLCDGTAHSRTTYANLFAALGVVYGNGDGSTTFNVPDLRGRTAMGAGTGTGTNATAFTLGQQPISGAGGEQAHAQQPIEMALHSHDFNIDTSGGYMVGNYNSIQKNGATPTGNGIGDDRGGGYFSPNYGTYGSIVNGAAQYSGGGQAANILSPVSVVNWFIKT